MTGIDKDDDDNYYDYDDDGGDENDDGVSAITDQLVRLWPAWPAGTLASRRRECRIKIKWKIYWKYFSKDKIENQSLKIIWQSR